MKKYRKWRVKTIFSSSNWAIYRSEPKPVEVPVKTPAILRKVGEKTPPGSNVIK